MEQRVLNIERGDQVPSLAHLLVTYHLAFKYYLYMTIGFIGQGWIGKQYADDFEARGHSVVHYARGAVCRKSRKDRAM